jgi:hypothetical protein
MCWLKEVGADIIRDQLALKGAFPNMTRPRDVNAPVFLQKMIR